MLKISVMTLNLTKIWDFQPQNFGPEFFEQNKIFPQAKI